MFKVGERVIINDEYEGIIKEIDNNTDDELKYYVIEKAGQSTLIGRWYRLCDLKKTKFNLAISREDYYREEMERKFDLAMKKIETIEPNKNDISKVMHKAYDDLFEVRRLYRHLKEVENERNN